jgi:hypothetical protein
VFRPYPDNEIATVAQVDSFKKKANPELYHQLTPQIKGYGVDFPLNFLSGENLKRMKHFEFGLFMLPNHIFT